MSTLTASKLVTSVSENERNRLAAHMETVYLEQGQTLLNAGEAIEHVWMPHDCITSTVVDTPEGQTIEVGLMGLDGMVGLSLIFGQRVSNTTVLVQIPGHATRMSASDFTEHVVQPRGEMYEAVLRYADAFMAMVAQTAACNSLHTVDQRLARWILMTQDRLPTNELGLTQEFLAYMLGVRRASVSMAAGALQDAQLIRYSRGHITVLDRLGLEKATCRCYGIVRSITDRLYGEEAA
jgi:CRP-like cAMP-binding protein